MALDKIDRKILAILQKDATTPVAEIGRKVGLSTTPCWRRIQKMEEDGVIRRRVALLDPVKVNTKVTVFVSIRTNTHSIEWLKRFSEVVSEFPEVVEFYRMSGDVDYLLRVAVPVTGTLTVTLKNGKTTYGKAKVKVKRRATMTVRVALSAATARRLRRGALTVTVAATLKPVKGPAQTDRSTLHLSIAKGAA